MIELVTFRAKEQDFAFCQRIYFDGMGWIIERLQLDMERQYEGFVDQWKAGEVRVIVVAGEDAGWRCQVLLQVRFGRPGCALNRPT